MTLTARELERADMAKLNAWRHDREVVGRLTGVFRYVGEEVDDAWFDTYLRSRGREVRLALLDDGKFVGVVYLLEIDQVIGSCHVGIVIGDKSRWGRGLGREALRLGVSHAFDDLNLRRIQVDILAEHEAALHLYGGAGFVREGVLRQAAYKAGGYHDVVVLSLLRDERPAEGR